MRDATVRQPPLVDGVRYDIPDAVRGFQRFDHNQRAGMMASHRLGFRQRERVGEAFWTHPLMPGLAFPTRIRALRAALATLRSEGSGNG